MGPGGCGLAATVHLEPFQRSMRTRFCACWRPPGKYSPTATQSEAPMQETDDKKLYAARAGFGLFTITHCDPFHRAASVLTCEPAELPLAPTAMHPQPRPHAMPARSANRAGRRGLATRDHAEPSQCAATMPVLLGPVTGWPVARATVPTATHSEASAQATPFRSARIRAGNAGPLTMVHRDAARRSISR